MDKYLITGFSGFVARHFLEYLEEQQLQVCVLGIDIHHPDFDIHAYRFVQCSFAQTDLLNRDEVDLIIYQFQPSYILHLASFSSVSFSWKNPVVSFTNNTNIFLNLLEKVRMMELRCRILSVGSSEEYGNVNDEDLPLSEDSDLNPLSPYAVARVSQEMLSKVYVDGYGMDVVMTRSFNHIGPGQRDAFVVSSFAKQLVELKRNGQIKKLVTGDLSIVRDFLDVRDVVKAYHILLKRGRKGEIYNVCSGRGTTLEKIVSKMMDLTGVDVTTVLDEKLIRPNDNRIIIGSNRKLREETGWKLTYDLEQSLQDIINYWDEQLAIDAAIFSPVQKSIANF